MTDIIPPQQAHTLAQHAIDAFEQVVGKAPGFRLRAGQRAMAECIAHTLSQAELGESARPQKGIAVIQAGTGVGKSAAYASTAIAMALERQTRVLISTATVALQEQLMTKDLPALAFAMRDTPFSYALAKGRGRYVCKLKLYRLIGTQGLIDDLLDDEPQVTAGAQQTATAERRDVLFNQLADQLSAHQWDGDRDTLPDAPDLRDWNTIAAERHTCTARHCVHFKDCSYFQARTRLTEANVIVANHDLVLASIGMKTLPELDNCLVIFDEGHHLPAIALDQFSSSMDLSNLRWLDKLPRALLEVSNQMQLVVTEDVTALASQLKTAMTQMAHIAMDSVLEQSQGKDGTLRFAKGQLPDYLQDAVTIISRYSVQLFKSLETLGLEVKAIAKEDPTRAHQCAVQFAKIGQFAPRLSSVKETSQLLLLHDNPPQAKWLEVVTDGPFITTLAHACPIVPGDLLHHHLWSQVRGAVVTSATLTSCGNFDYFLQEAGLNYKSYVQALEVSSPFNYAEQGTLTIVHTRADPKQAEAYTTEMVQLLMQDLTQVKKGALVLFTSRAQMRAATDALPSALKDKVMVQGTLSRLRLIAAHTARVESGMASVIFGLQSFGEGLDLPGELCETVLIAKLPFSPPSDPVDEARSEWLRSEGRDPFVELVIPATAIKLLQWSGRAIRTESDRAEVICYDKRLTQTSYGKRMLKGLPPYRLVERK
jgi:ATP-dependent DNA helicase DinG